MPVNKLNLNFNLRSPQASSPTPINLIIRYNTKQYTYPTSEKIHPNNWQGDKKKKNYNRAKSSFNEATELNSRLNNIESTVEEVFRRYKNDYNNSVPTWDKFKPLLDIAFKRVEQQSTELLIFVKEFISNAHKRINLKTGRKISSATIKKYQTVYNHLEAYSNKRKITLHFDSIDLYFYQDYQNFLNVEYNLAVNSIGKDITVIKAFLNDSFDKGLHKVTIHKNHKFASISEKADTIFLNKSELQKLYELDLTDKPTYEKVRDLFLIACYTGLRYSDYSALSKMNVQEGMITITQYKTGNPVKIPLHSIVKNIFEKYDYSLPKGLSNQKTNKYLKEIGEQVDELKGLVVKKITKGGISTSTLYPKYELITTHTGRRSFATNLYLEGFPALRIMKITGHKTESSFMAYIKIVDDSNALALSEHWLKAV